MKRVVSVSATLAFVLLALTLIAPTVSAAEIPRMISYQGRVLDSLGDPVTQTGVSFRFLIYDDSTAGGPGNALWLEVTSKDVVDGLVTHNMGSIVSIPDTLFTKFGQLWLEVMVDGVPIEPRSRMVSSGYAFRVSTIDSATGGAITSDVNINTSSISNGLHVTQTGSGRAGYFQISNVSSTVDALIGYSNGSGRGGYFFNDAGANALSAWTNGTAEAIRGISDFGTGGHFESGSTSMFGTAVKGILTSTSSGAFSAAVAGLNNGTGGAGIGLWGSHAGSGYGVYATSATGTAGFFVTSGGSDPALFVRTHGSGDAGQFKDGNVSVLNGSGIETIQLDPQEGSTGGQITLREADGTNGIILDGEKLDNVNHGQIDLYRGGTRTISIEGGEGSTGGQIRLRDTSGTVTITLDAEYGTGGDGRITTEVLQITGGSDLSEQFDILGFHDKQPEAGMVVCIDPNNPGKLLLSSIAYDPTVAGIISGAGGIKPGMLMGQQGTVGDGQFAVALTGRVYCWADASYGAIKPGDRLTTSATPGHAMKVTDNTRAVGAVIGKAMTTLTEGQGLVLTLVQPQ